MSPVGCAFDPDESASIYSTLILPPPSSPCRIPPDLSSCRLPGVFIMRPCLPYRHGNCVAAGLLGSPDITPVLRYYEPIHHRLAVSHFPGVAGYMTYPPPSISRWDEDGFSSCSACPCHRAVPNTPPECFIASVSLRRFMLPSPNRWGLGFRFKEFRGHLWVHFRYGPVTRSPSLRWLCQSASSDSFPPRMRPKLRGSDFYPGGTVSH
jgi:hypothetical protein